MAERQVVHLARLVDDLMDVARISQGKIELRKEVVDLATVVSQAVETARPLIDERRHRPDRLAARRADPAGGRPDAAGAGPLEPPEQRRQVHRAGRADRADGRAGGRRGRRAGAGHGHRHRAGDAAAGLRDVRPGRPPLGPRAGRAGDRPGPGEDPGRDARRDDHGLQRRAGHGAASSSSGCPCSPARRPSRPGRSRISARGAEAALPRRRILVVDDNVDAANSLASCCPALRPGGAGRPRRPGGPGGRPRSSAPRSSCSTSACRGWTATRSPGDCGRCPSSAGRCSWR